jgi:PKD repeat protein
LKKFVNKKLGREFLKKTIPSFLLVCFLVFSFTSAIAFSTHSTTIYRSFVKQEAVVGESITVTVSFVNQETYELRGFYYTEQIPDGLTVNTISVKIEGGTISNHVWESGSSGDVYQGFIPFRWIFETPVNFAENNPISPGSTIEIVYSISSLQPGTFSFNEFNWVGYYPNAQAGMKAAFGHSENADKETITFQSPEADFSANPRVGTAPLTVAFTDLSAGVITSWSWDFDNDGTEDSFDRNPIHVYTVPDTYSVALEVKGSGGTSTRTRANYITVTAPLTQYSLSVNTIGNGNVRLEPAGGTYDAGTEVQLTPVPKAGWAFYGWSGDLDGYCNPVTIVMNIDKTITATFDIDSDGDGISDAEEDAAPNSGDGNYDGIKDSDQKQVTSLHIMDGTDYVTLESGPGTTLASCRAADKSGASGSPSGITFPYDLFNFTIQGVGIGGATTLTLYFPAGKDLLTYWKYGRTPTDANPHWYKFMYEALTQTGAEIDGDIVTLHFVDGQRGDDILAQDGMIVDMGGPGTSGSSSSSSGGGGGGCFISTAASGLLF